jgi:hypothetical protein
VDDKDRILEELLLEFGSDAPETEPALTEPVTDEQVLLDLEEPQKKPIPEKTDLSSGGVRYTKGAERK